MLLDDHYCLNKKVVKSNEVFIRYIPVLMFYLKAIVKCFERIELFGCYGVWTQNREKQKIDFLVFPTISA